MKTVLRVTAFFSYVLTLAGAWIIAIATFQPWGQAKAFHSWPISVPGVVFASGVATLFAALAAMRFPRTAILCIPLAVFILGSLDRAQLEVPEAMIHQLAGLQISLFPINRLLDQFHVPDIEVGYFGTPAASYLAPGLDFAKDGAYLLLAGGILGLPSDPLIVTGRRRFGRTRCRNCKARWPTKRDAHNCPQCGFSVNGKVHCRTCGTAAESLDRFCVACGTPIPASGEIVATEDHSPTQTTRS